VNLRGIFQGYAKGILAWERNMPQEYVTLAHFLEKLERGRGGGTTHTPSIAKLTSMPKYMKIQKKPLLQRLLKMP